MDTAKFDLSKVTVLLKSGYEIPVIGIGTYILSDKQTESSVYHALREGCPAQIDIPAFLQLYAEHQDNHAEIVRQLQSPHSAGQPLDCIECSACSAHCPQQ